MTDETNTPEQDSDSSVSSTGVLKSVHIREMVADRIASFGNEVIGKVVHTLVEQEKERRAAAVMSALKQIDDLEKERRKFKPDVTTYNEDGSVKDTAWTKETIEAKKKNDEQLKKLNDALNRAFGGTPDWSKLFELTKGGK